MSPTGFAAEPRWLRSMKQLSEVPRGASARKIYAPTSILPLAAICGGASALAGYFLLRHFAAHCDVLLSPRVRRDPNNLGASPRRVAIHNQRLGMHQVCHRRQGVMPFQFVPFSGMPPFSLALLHTTFDFYLHSPNPRVPKNNRNRRDTSIRQSTLMRKDLSLAAHCFLRPRILA